ncbi:helix-turn-helix domain-containing protein [Hominenteromicrobium sp.]
MLLFSNYTNAQISEFLGFSNYSYFSRLFKKHTGVTPNDYRTHKNM